MFEKTICQKRAIVVAKLQAQPCQHPQDAAPFDRERQDEKDLSLLIPSKHYDGSGAL